MTAESSRKKRAGKQNLSELKIELNRALNLPIIATIVARLRSELSARFLYHTAEHTLDVISECLLFAMQEQVSERELELLAVAAAYHDSGYLEGPDDHEVRGAELVQTAMRNVGSYSEQEIKLVYSMICDTKLEIVDGSLKQIPHSKLSRYLLDADLSNFGRDDFLERLELDRLERGLSKAEAYHRTLSLFDQHVWHTESAKVLRQAKKEENLVILRRLCEGKNG